MQFATNVWTELVDIDEGTLCTFAATPSRTGEELFTFFRLADGFDRD
jgi:altronate dehydratase